MKTILYIHGLGGNAQEARHYQTLFPDYQVIGFDYKSQTPKEAQEEFSKEFAKYEDVIVLANSIGAYFTMIGGVKNRIQRAYFISPIIDMEKLILDRMVQSNVSEEQLKKQGTIATDFGEPLDWNYLTFVREHSIQWNVPTYVLYGGKDNLTSLETIKQFGHDYTVMKDGEHWFHTSQQMEFLDQWLLIKENLMNKLDQIHTTELGVLRLQKNLGIQGDVLEYCKKLISHPETIIYQRGKNWYCECEEEVLTINRRSLTIITGAKRKKV